MVSREDVEKDGMRMRSVDSRNLRDRGPAGCVCLSVDVKECEVVDDLRFSCQSKPSTSSTPHRTLAGSLAGVELWR